MIYRRRRGRKEPDSILAWFKLGTTKKDVIQILQNFSFSVTSKKRLYTKLKAALLIRILYSSSQLVTHSFIPLGLVKQTYSSAVFCQNFLLLLGQDHLVEDYLRGGNLVWAFSCEARTEFHATKKYSKNQNRCQYQMGSPPPAGSKKMVLIFRLVNSIVIAAARTGSARSRQK